jgi:predicted nucleic acid-binding protein
MVTDVEVLQEILHRFAAIRRQEAIDPAIKALLGLVDETYPIELEDVLRAKALVLYHADLPARNALHLAIMDRHRIPRIMSFDTHFDRFPQVTRIAVP